jgi:Tfp pilus assembly protein PilV
MKSLILVVALLGALALAHAFKMRAQNMNQVEMQTQSQVEATSQVGTAWPKGMDLEVLGKPFKIWCDERL